MNTDEPRQSAKFPSTHWTKVYLASEHEHDAGSKALADLLDTYRPALQQYLSARYRNISKEEIEDWVSGFIHKKIMEQHLLRRAHETKGRFRNYVLTALYRFSEDQRRINNRNKRRPAGGIVSLEETNELSLHLNNVIPNPGDAHWAVQVIEQARERTESFYREKERESTWLVFFEGFYLPLYAGNERPSDTELAKNHGFESARQVSNTITNAKRRFGNILREVVREYEQTEVAVDEEIRDLIAIVSENHQIG